jgi:hypothetical protein
MAIYSGITGKKSFTGTAPQLANEIIRLREQGVPVSDTRSVKTYTSSIFGKPFPFLKTEQQVPEQPEQDLGGFPQPKKRGRPTKEEQQKKAEEEARANLEKSREASSFLQEAVRKAQQARTKARQEEDYQKVLAATLQAEKPKAKVQTKSPFAKGKGVEREFYPKLVPFGAIMISPAQLFYYKLLRVREPTKHSIRGMPDVRVSEDMVHILMKIINGGTPSMTELKALSDDEKTIYDDIIMKAKLHKEMPQSYAQSGESSINKLKKRLELLEGEWSAGNDNTLIKKELNSVIRQLTELKAISEVEGRKYLKQF